MTQEDGRGHLIAGRGAIRGPTFGFKGSLGLCLQGSSGHRASAFRNGGLGASPVHHHPPLALQEEGKVSRLRAERAGVPQPRSATSSTWTKAHPAQPGGLVMMPPGPPLRLLELSTAEAFRLWCQKGHPWGRSTHCSLIVADVLLFLFFQSLKSDEEADSTKEPQNELFEAQGKAWPCGECPLWSVLGLQAAGCQRKRISWEVPSVGGLSGVPFSWVVPALRFLRSDPWAGAAG